MSDIAPFISVCSYVVSCLLPIDVQLVNPRLPFTLQRFARTLGPYVEQSPVLSFLVRRSWSTNLEARPCLAYYHGGVETVALQQLGRSGRLLDRILLA